MRMEFATRLAAQNVADSLHARLIASNPVYAACVSVGQTTAWAIPYQDRDRDDQPTGNWWVNLKPRIDGVLTAQERSSTKPYSSAPLAASR